MVFRTQRGKHTFFLGFILLLFILFLIQRYHYESFVETMKTHQQALVENQPTVGKNRVVFSDPENPMEREIIQPVPVVPVLTRDPKEINAIDRVTNPLRYPYKSDWYYERDWYPDQYLTPEVVGCGGRSGPCGGGSQTIIPNFTVPIEVSDRNIAPVTVFPSVPNRVPIQISTRGPLGEPQQVGVIMKLFGDENTVYPLFGRRRYPRQDVWDYYTLLGPYGAKVPILRRRNNMELGNNDIVMIQGQKDQYRVTIYETDFPQYIPYA
jgi:hypothetical protein